MKAIVPFLAIIVLCAAPGAAAVVSTFDTGPDGWMVADFDPGYHQPSVPLLFGFEWGPFQGLNGGGLRVGELTYWTHIAAPAGYLGDWRHGMGQTLEFDLLITYTDGMPYSSVAVRGLGKTLFYVVSSPPLGAWTHMSAPLGSGDWRVNSYHGEPATALDFWEVLRSVEGLYLMTEWCTGPDDTLVDNVALNLDPVRPDGIHILARDTVNQAAIDGSKHFRFTLTGAVSALDSTGFDLDDRSGRVIRVAAAELSGISAGDLVSATGVLDAEADPPVLASSALDIVKH